MTGGTDHWREWTTGKKDQWRVGPLEGRTTGGTDDWRDVGLEGWRDVVCNCYFWSV